MGRLALWALTGALWIAVAAGAAAPASAQLREGAYIGVDAAKSLALWVDQVASDAVRGRIRTGSAGVIPFAGAPTDDGGIVEYQIGDGVAMGRIVARPLSLTLIEVPLDAEGKPLENYARAFPFVREGLRLPDKPKVARPPLSKGSRRVDALDFLDNYPFWASEDVAFAYDAMEEEWRAIIRLYPHLQTDVIWKLCGSVRPARRIDAALRGQGVSCDDVLSAVDSISSVETYNAYKAAADAERWTAYQVVACSRGMTPENQCGEFSRRTAAAAAAAANARTIIDGLR